MLLILFFVSIAFSHSWVEQLSVIGRDGLLRGAPGYPRGNVLRTSSEFNDNAMTYLLPPQSGLDYICAPSQREPVQTQNSPRLHARRGDQVILRYQENGHVTLPWIPPGKPPLSGKIYIYGTTAPTATDLLSSIHKKWNEDGSGGNQQGRLLGTFDFDDGRCFQVNDSPISRYRRARFGHAPQPPEGNDLWCVNTISIPLDIESNMLSLYWVWDWPTNLGGIDEKQEIYTTCMDIELSSHQTCE
ncbi:hypothetical protein BJX63DRAFT_425663 [Aspergillus granulosus]|uniref:DUF7492 domain-containing protein n=1 Tax=Aspergillus granulosus TaxID=176169 RepID=A0ABR4GV62_9EURO